MKTASNAAPNKCELCNETLEKPEYKYEILISPCKAFPRGLISTSSGQWRVDCKCGACYLWWGGYDAIWYLRTHRILELLMPRSRYTKELIKPLNVMT